VARAAGKALQDEQERTGAVPHGAAAAAEAVGRDTPDRHRGQPPGARPAGFGTIAEAAQRAEADGRARLIAARPIMIRVSGGEGGGGGVGRRGRAQVGGEVLDHSP
jgi:hypothetical protein